MKVAILGAWHVHATDYTKAAQENGCEVVGVWDEREDFKHALAQKHHIPEFETVEDLLASDCEAVIVCTATNKHADDMVMAADAKKDIFTEKVLALTVEDCLRVKDAVEKNGVRFVISFPWKFNPAYLALKNAVDSGKLGRINYTRFRNCHSGSLAHWLPAHFYNKEECGGGAMIDLGAHGMYLTHWILGEPISYSSTFTHFCRDEQDAVLNPDAIEDNAVTVMTYESGAIAINETGFVTKGCKETFEIGGENGYLVSDGVTATFAVNKFQPESLELPKAEDKPILQFLKGKTPEGCGMDEAIALTKMMIGAYSSIKK